MELLDRLGNYATVALGLGFVIFWHELGHFLVAKLFDVKVLKFSVGFGPALLKVRRGETEYALSAIPLGGFVKMLGEEPEEGEEAEKTSDPRAYSNKSVGARMAIITAGVVMNLILGVICFVVAYGHGGLPEVPAILGPIRAGGPAWEAGLRPGDEILRADDVDHPDFDDLSRITSLSDPGQVLHLTVRRRGVAEPFEVEVRPRRGPGDDAPMMGIGSQASLDLAEDRPFAPPAGLDGPAPKGLDGARRLVAAGPPGDEPRPLDDVLDFYEQSSQQRSGPLALVVEGKPGERPRRVNLPACRVVTFGFRLTPGPVVAVRPGSPAEAAGIQPGDRIVAVDGDEAFDPLRLPDLVHDRDGSPLPIDVERKSGRVSLTATPDTTALPPWIEPIMPDEPLEVPGLGLALRVEPKVAAVADGSPADRAGITPGASLTAVELLRPDPVNPDAKPESFRRKLVGDDAVTWPYIFDALQFLPRHAVALSFEGRPAPVTLTPEPDPSWFTPQRGLLFVGLERPLPPLPVGASIRRGMKDTQTTIVAIYQMLRNLLLGRISTKAVGGPFLIAGAASHFAEVGVIKFLQFLGLISVNLAVMNFLPIPPLDGGQFCFLAAEKLRGRPLPDRILIAGQMAGLLLVVGLMVFVLIQDVLRHFGLV